MRTLLPLSLLVLAACAPAPAAPAGGLTMLDVMFQIEHAYREIEPNLRNVSALEDTADAARRIADWGEDRIFEDFLETDRFFSDRGPFLAQRDALVRGAKQVLAGAEEPDLTAIRHGFIEMKKSCIACHKRFSPSY